MSDVLYPLGPVGSLDVKRFDRTVFDEFEDGSTTARRLWTAKTFKRRFEISHQNLTETEMRKLGAFLAARDGRYDAFWFRDNWNRGGNAKVRLAPPPHLAAPKYVARMVCFGHSHTEVEL